MSSESFLSTREIGVVGFGMFGKLLCGELLKGLKITVYSPHLSKDDSTQKIKPVKTIKELVQNSDFIIPAVPISKFEKIISEIIPYLNKDTIIMDVCSVKSHPVKLMQKLLPDSIHKIATHPMFGPSSLSLKGTFSGFPMVIYNAGCDQVYYAKVKQYFTDLGLQVTEMQPDKHDALTAKSQFFSQLIRAATLKQDIHPTSIDTPAASKLFEAFGLMDISRQLLIDMLNYNKYAQRVLNDTIKSLTDLKRGAKNKKHE